MTSLAAVPVDPDQLDLLSLVADEQTPLGSLHRDDFRRACHADAMTHDGWVHPNRVSALLHRWFGDVNPRWFSSQWAPACGPNGFLDKTDIQVPIDATHSKGNGNKTVRLRRWRASP
jgi:hypothetical protein